VTEATQQGSALAEDPGNATLFRLGPQGHQGHFTDAMKENK